MTKLHFYTSPRDAACGARQSPTVISVADPGRVTCGRCLRLLLRGVRIQDPDAGPLTIFWPPRQDGQVIR